MGAIGALIELICCTIIWCEERERQKKRQKDLEEAEANYRVIVTTVSPGIAHQTSEQQQQHDWKTALASLESSHGDALTLESPEVTHSPSDQQQEQEWRTEQTRVELNDGVVLRPVSSGVAPPPLLPRLTSNHGITKLTPVSSRVAPLPSEQEQTYEPPPDYD